MDLPVYNTLQNFPVHRITFSSRTTTHNHSPRTPTLLQLKRGWRGLTLRSYICIHSTFRFAIRISAIFSMPQTGCMRIRYREGRDGPEYKFRYSTTCPLGPDSCSHFHLFNEEYQEMRRYPPHLALFLEIYAGPLRGQMPTRVWLNLYELEAIDTALRNELRLDRPRSAAARGRRQSVIEQIPVTPNQHQTPLSRIVELHAARQGLLQIRLSYEGHSRRLRAPAQFVLIQTQRRKRYGGLPFPEMTAP
jgi:hypothetical protein